MSVLPTFERFRADGVPQGIRESSHCQATPEGTAGFGFSRSPYLSEETSNLLLMLCYLNHSSLCRNSKHAFYTRGKQITYTTPQCNANDSSHVDLYTSPSTLRFFNSSFLFSFSFQMKPAIELRLFLDACDDVLPTFAKFYCSSRRFTTYGVESQMRLAST